jgi:hypothetical protein
MNFLDLNDDVKFIFSKHLQSDSKISTMRMFVCVYVYMFVCMYVWYIRIIHTYVCMYYVRMYVHITSKLVRSHVNTWKRKKKFFTREVTQGYPLVTPFKNYILFTASIYMEIFIILFIFPHHSKRGYLFLHHPYNSLKTWDSYIV